MSINPNKTLLGLTFKGDSVPLAEPTAKGLADGSLTSFSAPDLGVTSLMTERFRGFSSLQTLDLTGITSIPAYTAYQCKQISSLILDPNITFIGDYAFYQCEKRLSTYRIDLQMNNGSVGYLAFGECPVRSVKGSYSSIGAEAFRPYSSSAQSSNLEEVDITVTGNLNTNRIFSSHIYVSKFKLVAQSGLTDLSGQYIFSGVGAQRANPENNVFVFDFRNSMLSAMNILTFSGFSNYHNKYFDIYFPASLGSLCNFEYCDNINIFYKSIPSLSNVSRFSGATNFKNFFPYNLAQTAKTSTNWSSSSYGIVNSIYGYAEENTFSQGDTLPVTDANGYELTWYSDVALTNQVTTVTDPTQIYYCAVGAQVATPLTILEYQATVAVSDGTNTYVSGQLIPFNTTITITAIGQGANTTPYIFTLNGTTISSGDTYTVTSSDNSVDIVCAYYDGINVPFETTFANNSPAQIKNAVDSGIHRLLWNIGDTKTIILTDNTSIDIRYIDKQVNRYQKSDSSGYTNAVFEFITLPMIAQINTSNTNSGGWPASKMCTTMSTDIWPLFPSDWQSVMSECKVPSASGSTNTTLVYANNKVFIPSGEEIFGNQYTGSQYNNESCTQFDYYSINSANSYKIKQYSGTSTSYWLRSPNRSGGYFCRIYTNGSVGYDNNFNDLGVSVTFAI